MDKMRMESVNMTVQNVEKIGAMFPNCITETVDKNGELKKAINFELLKQMLSEDIVKGDEAYEFKWVGKKASVVEANKPTNKTLRPCKEESVNWNTTENLYIEGDNLEVLKILQKSYFGKVKMIYIDPPYNTGNDFIYRDNFQMSKDEYSKKISEYDENKNRLFKNTESNGRFHSDWCSMMYSRLMLARNLLSNDGVIFVSIDDNEQENLKKICNEIFGEENFICNFIRKNKVGSGHDSNKIAIEFDYILCYSKNFNENNINQEKVNIENDIKYKLEDKYVKERGKYYLRDLDYKGSYSEKMDYPITTPDGKIIYSGGTFGKPNTWRWSKEKFEWGLKNDYIVFKENNKKWKVYIKQYQYVDNTGKKYIRTIPYRALIDFSNGQGTLDFNSIMEINVFYYPKSIKLLKHLLEVASNKNSIILDFFSGSATTAHAVMQFNAEDGGHRKFIMVQLPEETNEKSEAFKAGYKNICEIGKERIRRAAKKIKEENPSAIFDSGFRVFKLDESNMKDVYYSVNEYNQNLILNLEDNVKEGRTDIDLLFSCLLEWCFPLSLSYVSEKIDNYTIHNYNNGDLIACFDKNISKNIIETIANLQPLYAVFRDNSFLDSSVKINVSEIFKSFSPNTKVKII